ncbi:MAG: type IV secretory pathway VirB6-like protein [Lentimonas sp.]
MKINSLLSTIVKLTTLCLLVASFLLFSTKTSFALIDGVRESTIDSNGRCQTEELKFDPVGYDSDIDWDIWNPTCISYFALYGAQMFASESLRNSLCVGPLTAKKGVDIVREKATGRFVTAKTVIRQAADVAKCTLNTTACLSSFGTVTTACGSAASCCPAVLAHSIAFGIGMAELAAIYGAALESQRNAYVCGEKWEGWRLEADGANAVQEKLGLPGSYLGGALVSRNSDKIYPEKIYSYGGGSNSYKDSLKKRSLDGIMNREISEKEYREFIYNGMEFEDNGPEACKNPESWRNIKPEGSTKTIAQKILGHNDSNQKYYMRGANQTSNYACRRFLLNASAAIRGLDDSDIAKIRQDAKNAYDCCNNRSQNTMCIEEIEPVLGAKQHRFCKEGEKCTVRYVSYEIYPSKYTTNYLCAKTYSVCPYNHALGGGTEIQDYSKEHGIILNHCQHRKHCVKKPSTPYVRISGMGGSWFSSSCLDLKGDSQNEYEYDGFLTPIHKTKHFSAPIAQCFKETMENLLLNKAGNTKCLDPSELPNKDGDCDSGYFYKKGEFIEGQKSPFQKIQDGLRSGIKIVLTLAITIFGLSLLMTGKVWERKEIMMFLIKLGLVSYFALGTAWQDFFVDGVYSTSAQLTTIFSQTDDAYLNNFSKLDGCQFPRFNYETGSVSNPAYPPGQDYLKVWDALDCKIALSLGFGPNVSVPNLVIMIFAGLLTSGFGILFFLSAFVFAFYLISLTIRALHIFVMASIAVALLIYISPIAITTVLFKKTESIFKKWKTHLLLYAIQPAILFAYLAVLIAFFEGTMIGDVTFEGNGYEGPKTIKCIDSEGNSIDNSIYCIFNIADLRHSEDNALDTIGIYIPALFEMNEAKMFTIMKAAFLMFIFAQFLNKIGEFIQYIMGGSVALDSQSKGVAGVAGVAAGVTKGAIKRGTGALRKHGGTAARYAGKAVNKQEQPRADNISKTAAPVSVTPDKPTSGGTTI